MHKDLGVSVEIASQEDFFSIREICILASSFEDLKEKGVRSLEAQYFSEFWVGPYLEYLQSYVFVAKNSKGKVLAYLTGAPDTRKLEELKSVGQRKILIEEAKRGLYGSCEENFWLDKHLKRLDAGKDLEAVRNVFSKKEWSLLEENFPAHLHINVHPDYQSRGLGSLLLKSFFKKLKHEDLTGVHVACDESSLSFYQKNGFEVFYEKSSVYFNESKKRTVYLLVKSFKE